MPATTRNRVFISYRHHTEDQKILEELRVHLRPWERRTTLDVWSDQQITPSEDWHRKIHEALASTAVAILLVSPKFLDSTYIATYELPYLLRACEAGEVRIVPFYLRTSSVDALPFDVELPSGKKTPVKLTKYQGFNDPRVPLASLHDRNQRDEIYTKAASHLRELVSPPSPPRTLTSNRFELTIQLTRNGNQLTRIYLHHYGRFAPEHRSPWQGTTSLFDTLFGSQEHCDKVLRLLFDAKEDLARPIRHPVRVRLHTTDPELANLPWARTAWEGETLCDHGWTFELINEYALEHFQGTTQALPDVILKAPCPVLMIAPSTAPGADAHYRALEERLKHAWPSSHESPQLAHSWQEVEEAWRKRKPRIVYYYGPAESDGKTLTLQLDGPQGLDRRPVTALADLWRTEPPHIVFGNVVGEQVAPGVALAALNVPLAIMQNASDPAEARHAALAWLHEVLEQDGETFPVSALHQHGLRTAVAWGAYDKWTTRTNKEPAREKLAHFLLDRKQQRALGHDALRELLRDGERRVCNVLAYGAEENLAALFAAQLYEHLRRNATDVANVYRVPLRLPTASTFDVAKMEFEVRRQLGLSDRDPLGSALEQRIQRGPSRLRPVLLLDWGVRGTAEHARLSIAGLEAWLVFCRQQLCNQCPKDLRILSCLSLELPTDRHATLEHAVNNLLREARFRDRAFRLELLPPLSHVSGNDLAAFLDGPGNSTCPDDLIPVMPELIVQQTSGLFRQTVELIERAERTSWYDLHDKLQAQLAPAHAGATLRDDLL